MHSTYDGTSRALAGGSFGTDCGDGSPVSPGICPTLDQGVAEHQDPEGSVHHRTGRVMRFIPTKFHGALDYLVGTSFIVLPWLSGFASGGPETWVFLVLGAVTIVYSLLTDYEWGLLRRLAMPAHLLLDGLSGVLLAASPWLFGFADQVYLPHLILGLFEIVASLVTHTRPAEQRSAIR